MRSVEEIITEALSLPIEARALLAKKLVQSLELSPDEMLQTRRENVANQRQAKTQSGTVESSLKEENFQPEQQSTFEEDVWQIYLTLEQERAEVYRRLANS